MSDINIPVEAGKSILLETAGKLCDKNIVVTALGGTETAPTAFTVASVDELPANAPDGSMAIVDDGDDTLGAWKLNNELDFSTLPEMDNEYELDFSSNGIDFISFDLYPNDIGDKNGSLYFYSASGSTAAYETFGGTYALSSAYQFFHINDYPKNDVMTWIRANAEKAKLVYTRIDGEWVRKSINESYGIADGKQQAYDAFWDDFQDNGNRTNYQYAFAYSWTDEIYNPKYPIVCNTSIYDASYMFYASKKLTETRVPITLSNTRADSTFNACDNLRRIQLLICDNVVRFSNTFRYCGKLEEITIDGEIGVDISFSDSPLLTTASVQSVIDHLKDLTGATAQTLTFHATVGGKLTEEQKAAISAKNWTLVY